MPEEITTTENMLQSQPLTSQQLEEVRYSRAWASVQATAKYAVEHPGRLALWALIPKTLIGGYYGRGHDKYLARILIQIALMSHNKPGEDGDIEKIYKKYVTEYNGDKGNNSEARFKELYYGLCDHFNELYDRAVEQAKEQTQVDVIFRIRNEGHDITEEQKEEYEAIVRKHIDEEAFKKLKKRIHDFAEHHHLERRLFNLKKENEKNKSFAQAVSLDTLGRKYAYVKNQENKFTPKKQKRRRYKKILNAISWLITMTVGTGEGMVAAFLGQSLFLIALAGVFIPIPPVALAILLVGIPGFLVNVFTFKGDSRRTLYQLFITGLFKDEKGNPIPKWKKILLIPTVGLTMCTGAIFGILSFTSAHATIIGILAVIGISSAAFPPAGIVVLAAFIAIMTGAALTSLLYVALIDLIKNDRIPQAIRYFKETFFTVHDLSKMGIAKHILKCVFELAFLSFGVGFAILLTVASAGMTHHTAIGFLKGTLHLSARISPLIAHGITSVAYIIQGIFNIKNVNSGFNSLRNAVIGKIGSLIEFIRHPQVTIREAWNEAKANPIRTLYAVGKGLLRSSLFGFISANAYAWSAVGANKASKADLHTVTRLPKTWNAYIGSITSGVASALINGPAAAAETALAWLIKKFRGIFRGQGNSAEGSNEDSSTQTVNVQEQTNGGQQDVVTTQSTDVQEQASGMQQHETAIGLSISAAKITTVTSDSTIKIGHSRHGFFSQSQRRAVRITSVVDEEFSNQASAQVDSQPQAGMSLGGLTISE